MPDIRTLVEGSSPARSIAGRVRARLLWIPAGAALALTSACDPGADGTRPLDPTDLPPIHVNEFVASNGDGLTDEGGNRPDWLELYNAGDEEWSLADWILADDVNEPDPGRLGADVAIDAGGYLVLFADGDPEEGALHLGFRLDKDGEDIVLADQDGNVVDLVRSYPPQDTDVAWARVPDGSRTWVEDDTPTPGSSNAADRRRHGRR